MPGRVQHKAPVGVRFSFHELLPFHNVYFCQEHTIFPLLFQAPAEKAMFRLAKNLFLLYDRKGKKKTSRS
jgi:hypothetical protein